MIMTITWARVRIKAGGRVPGTEITNASFDAYSIHDKQMARLNVTFREKCRTVSVLLMLFVGRVSHCR